VTKKILRELRLTLDSYVTYFSRVDKTPNLFNAFQLVPYFLIRRFQGFALLLRFIKSSNYASEGNLRTQQLPTIELLFISTKKDSSTLVYAIEKARNHSINPVSKVIVIVPEAQLNFFFELLADISIHLSIEIVSEDSEIDTLGRSLIKRTMKDRYGWTLQQFLTVSYCLRSNAAGVLAVNSDTIILRDQVWLDSIGIQILMESYEYNREYYKLLESVNNKFSKLKISHITHHMLFQPKLLQECLDYFNVSNLSEFIELFMNSVNTNSSSPICAEFEPYAQFLRKERPGSIKMLKFSNIGVERNKNGDLSNLINRFESESHYNSISLHSWMV
jgi:hypothetical protein